MSAPQAQTTDAGRIPGPHLRVAIGAGLTAIALSITITALSFFTNAVLAEHPDWAISTFTLYYTIYGLASAFAMPVAAQLLPKLGSRKLLMLGGTIAAIGLFLFSLATALWMFYGAALIVGIGVGLSVQYVPIVLVNRWFVARRALILGLVLAGTGVGGAAFSSILPGLIASTSWQLGMVVVAIAMFVFSVGPAILLIRNVPEDVGERAYGAGERPTDPKESLAAERIPGLTRAEAMKTPWLYILFGSVLLMGIVHSMNQHLVNYLKLQPWGINVPDASISLILTVTTLSLVLYKPALGWLIDRIGIERALVITLSLAAIVVFISAYMTLLWAYIACMLVIAIGFANGTVTPPLVAAHAFGQRDFPAIWGVLGSAYPIGTAVGAPLWGLVRDATGSYGWGFVSVPIISAIFIIGMVVVMRRGRKLWSSEGLATH